MKLKNDNTTRKNMVLSIKLGNPKHQCARYGICEINPDDDGSFYLPSNPLVDKKVRATVFTTRRRQLLFFFDRHSLTALTHKDHFSTGFFVIETAKELPLSVSNKLGLCPCQIETGIYPIVQDNDFYKITMNIKSISDFKQDDCACAKNLEKVKVEGF
jgi:hypothetical protein